MFFTQFSLFSFRQIFLQIYFQYLYGDLCHFHWPHRLVTGQKFSQNCESSVKFEKIEYFSNFTVYMTVAMYVAL